MKSAAEYLNAANYKKEDPDIYFDELEKIINDARRDAIKECAEQEAITMGMMGDTSNPIFVDKKKILQLLDQIK